MFDDTSFSAESFSQISWDGVAAPAPIVTGDYPFFSKSFWATGFWSEGFWGSASLTRWLTLRRTSPLTLTITLKSRLN